MLEKLKSIDSIKNWTVKLSSLCSAGDFRVLDQKNVRLSGRDTKNKWEVLTDV